MSGRLTINVENRSLKSCAVFDVRRHVSSKLLVLVVLGEDESEEGLVSVERFVQVDMEKREADECEDEVSEECLLCGVVIAMVDVTAAVNLGEAREQGVMAVQSEVGGRSEVERNEEACG